jgi:hypothetical protein
MAPQAFCRHTTPASSPPRPNSASSQRTQPNEPQEPHTSARLLRVALLPAFVILALSGGARASDVNDPGTGSTQQIAPLVQPSVVYETITWSGYVYDTVNKGYLRTDAPFIVRMQCSGFVVNPDGWVATAGPCVDPELEKEAIRRAAADWALTNSYYMHPERLTVEDVVGDYASTHSTRSVTRPPTGSTGG